MSSLYKELVYKIVEKINNEPYFNLPNKMSKDVTRRNQSLYCLYHQDQGHTTEDCRTLKNHLNPLEKAGYLKEFFFVDDSRLQDLKGASTLRTSAPTRGLIGVIHTARKRVEITKSSLRVSAMASRSDSKVDFPTHKKGRWEDDNIDFAREDLEGTIQPHKDALVVSLRIRGFDVRRVIIDQGNRAEIIYLDLHEGLGLTSDDSTRYDSPPVAFDRIAITPTRKVTLPVEVRGRKELVDFIVVHSYSPYTAILRHPWIHSMGAVPSSLHQKVKFPIKQGIVEIHGD